MYRKSSYSTAQACVEVELAFVKSSHSAGNGCVEVAFAKSSYSAASNCVEVAHFKSSYSGAENCVEVAFDKSSYCSAGNCVEVGVAKKSSHSSNGGDCVEAEGLPEGWVAVRDSKQKPDYPQVLNFSTEQWEELLDEIQDGSFNWNTFMPLQFTEEERRAFVLGVLDGEFDLVEAA